MIRHLVIDIAILAGFVWCSEQPYSDYLNCKRSVSDGSCYTGNSVFKSWERSDINIFSNTVTVCNVKTEYVQLINCDNERQQCLPDDRTKELFMTAAAEEKGFLHICLKPEAMNITCLERSGPGISECQKQAKLGPTSKNATFEEWKENRCRTITVSYECTRDSELLKGCPEVRSIFLEYSRITYPKACGDLLNTNNEYSDYLNCKRSVSDDSCYTGNSVFKSWERSDINIFSNTVKVCNVKTEYVQLINCINERQQCLQDDRTKELFMTAAAEEKGFLHICLKPEAMNITCLERSGPGISECQKQAKLGPTSKNATFEEWKENRCRTITVSYECTRDSELLKGCPEVRSIFLEYSRITYPKACGDLLEAHNGQPSILKHLLSFSQLTLILIITVSNL